MIIKGVRELHAELSAKKYKYNRPGLERPEWGGTEVTVIDPANNCITFAEFDDAIAGHILLHARDKLRDLSI